MSNSASRAGRSASRIASAPRSVRRASRRARACGSRSRCASACGRRSGSPPARSSRRRRRTARCVLRRSSKAARPSRTAAAAMLIEWRADLGRRAHFLGDRERALEQLVQRGAERAGLVGLAHRLLHLAEDLRLAEHHRVEAAGDAERMARRRPSLQHVRVVTQGAGWRRRPMPASQSTVGATSEGSRADIDLGAVAGREDRHLTARARDRPRNAFSVPFELVGREREPAAQIERRGRVVEPEGKDAHLQIIKFDRVSAGRPDFGTGWAPILVVHPVRNRPGAACVCAASIQGDRIWSRSTPFGMC